MTDRVVRGSTEELGSLVQAQGPAFLDSISSKGLGNEVRSARSSWVRRVRSGDSVYFVKTYDYPGTRAAIRGLFRNTFLARSRPAREFDALAWLLAASFAAPQPVCVLERRRFGWLRRAVLITRAWSGEQVDRILERSSAEERGRIAAAVTGLVAALHRRGFRDGNLDLRNLLARREGDAWVVAKLDSPRWRLSRPGREDGRTRADWARLLPQLRVFVAGAAAPPTG